jgi:hypothetical protein
MDGLTMDGRKWKVGVGLLFEPELQLMVGVGVFLSSDRIAPACL